MKVQEIVRKVLQTPLFLQRNACGIAHSPAQHWDCAVRLFSDFIVAALALQNCVMLFCYYNVYYKYIASYSTIYSSNTKKTDSS